MNGHGLFDYQEKIEQICKDFGFHFGALALIQPANDQCRLKWEYATGNQSDRYKRIKLQSNKGIAGTVFKTGKPMFIQDTKVLIDANGLYNYPIVAAEALKCFGAIPLFKYNRVVGILLVGNREDKKMTEDGFTRFIQDVGPVFGPLYYKEMLQS